MTEYKGKELLASIGIPVPAGGLATTLQQAGEIAERIGFPVVLKAQEVTLTHKSDIGGVILNIKDEDALEAGWKQLYDNIARARPGLILDGALVEKMGARGLELIVGVKNDEDWGPALLVGFGGVLAEAIGDVRLLPPDLPVQAIMDEMYQLKSAAQGVPWIAGSRRKSSRRTHSPHGSIHLFGTGHSGDRYQSSVGVRRGAGGSGTGRIDRGKDEHRLTISILQSLFSNLLCVRLGPRLRSRVFFVFHYVRMRRTYGSKRGYLPREMRSDF
jgi:hypothetical protein